MIKWDNNRSKMLYYVYLSWKENQFWTFSFFHCDISGIQNLNVFEVILQSSHNIYKRIKILRNEIKKKWNEDAISRGHSLLKLFYTCFQFWV